MVRKKEVGPRDPPGLRLVRKGMDQGWEPPIAKLIGFKLTKVGKGTARVELDVGPQHANPMGTLHGGVVCDVSDAAMGIAYVSTLGEDESFTTMELKVNFLRPVWTGRIVANATVMRKGRTTGLIVCKVLDEKGKLVAFATSTCMTIPGAAGRELVRERLSQEEAGRAPVI
ncbi:MAG: PaaI family thioesterase [Thaumarchaeota archaeon]|nr:PaaI family thioesterase [Nitrososphaerota archaeon]